MAADSAPINLTHHFLIAMPGLSDELFGRSVVFMCEHSERGALGLVINKPSDILLPRLFEKVDLQLHREDLMEQPVFQGGPVQTERGFVLHEAVGGDADESVYASTLSIPGGLEMTTSKDVLEALASGAGPRRVFVSLGYSSWGQGQLESEIAENSWLTVPADVDLIFDVPVAERYTRALALLGLQQPWSSRPMPATLDISTAQTFLAFDVGLKRTGVASGNRLTRSATPQPTIVAEGDARLEQAAARIREWQPDALVVGVPFHPDGAAHANTAMARKFARRLRGRHPLPVFEVDERYSTTEALSRGAKDADAEAACIILEQFLRSLP